MKWRKNSSGAWEPEGGYVCGASGKACDKSMGNDGMMPCGECAVGIAFKKKWENEPKLMDD